MGERPAGFIAEADALSLLFVGGCVRVHLHAFSLSLYLGLYQEDYRLHLTLGNSTIHNDMKLDIQSVSLQNTTMKTYFLMAALLGLALRAQAVEFPGPAPGAAKATQQKGVYTLSNHLLSLSWRAQAGQLRPAGLSNALNAQPPLPGEREIFRISTAGVATQAAPDGFYLGWRLDAKNITAVYGDGKSWRTLKSLARAHFTGVPTILRVGKLSLKADNTDYGDPGVVGTTRLEDITPRDLGAPTLAPSPRAGTHLEFNGGTLKINTTANTTAFAEWPLKPNTNFVAARIWKESDQAESWGPGLALRWPDGKFALINARSPLGQFSIVTPEGETLLTSLPPARANYDLPASDFRLVGAPQVRHIAGGQEIVAQLRHPTRPIDVAWRAILRDGSHYVRQEVDIHSTGAAGTLANIELVDFPVAGTEQVGTVPGSPLCGANWFFGAELPVGANDATDGAQTSVACRLPLETGASYKFASVAGVYPTGQLRRSVLAYIERERARPTKPFLHYNCWYDFAQNVNATNLADAIAAFHDAMTVQRGVQVDSYVIDDGWDDSQNTFWGVDKKKFPDGFAPIAAQLKADNSHLGLWISPLGGYGEAEVRTENARKLGLVETDKGLDLSYAPYYNWFRDKCLSLMRDYGVNYFKWDKAGEGVTPHFMALVRVANELRRANPDLFLNVTVGTWPSPFWLNHIDSTWRSGGDMGWSGAGNKREQWLNYRDEELYHRVVQPAPLYPLNSIMHHGLVLGRAYQGAEVAVAGPDLKHDARLYFANGAALQELYLTPSLMTKAGWDDVAAGAKWARANFDVLADSHWVGGDPGRGEVYGYASWAPRKGIFVLRNPMDKAGQITIDAATMFELPTGAKRHFKLQTPYADQRLQYRELRAGTPVTFTLEPFEVLVFEAMPQRN